VLGGVAVLVGIVCVLGLGLCTTAPTWVLAA
jgi:hypothetical protein